MATEEQEFDLSMPAVVDKYKSAGTVANGTKSFCLLVSKTSILELSVLAFGL